MKCFEYNLKNKINCDRKKCRYWIELNSSMNCCLQIKEKKEKMTLEEIGSIFNVTRMRICQIEKKAIQKLKDVIRKSL